MGFISILVLFKYTLFFDQIYDVLCQFFYVQWWVMQLQSTAHRWCFSGRASLCTAAHSNISPLTGGQVIKSFAWGGNSRTRNSRTRNSHKWNSRTGISRRDVVQATVLRTAWRGGGVWWVGGGEWIFLWHRVKYIKKLFHSCRLLDDPIKTRMCMVKCRFFKTNKQLALIRLKYVTWTQQHAWNTSPEHNNKDLNRLRYRSPHVRANTQYLNSSKGTSSEFLC